LTRRCPRRQAERGHERQAGEECNAQPSRAATGSKSATDQLERANDPRRLIRPGHLSIPPVYAQMRTRMALTDSPCREAGCLQSIEHSGLSSTDDLLT